MRSTVHSVWMVVLRLSSQPEAELIQLQPGGRIRFPLRLLDISKVQKLICAQPETMDDNDCSEEEQEEIELPISV